MPVWTPDEQRALDPIVETMVGDLAPLSGKRILVLCSAAGDVAGRIADQVDGGEVIGLEYADDLLAAAREAAAQTPERPVRYHKADMDHIPFPDASFSGVASEFIVYPTSQATEIGQPEMARVLRPGGVMSITDVIVPVEPPANIRAELTAVGLDYLCVATAGDFRDWMEEAALADIEIQDLTQIVRPVWEKRLAQMPDSPAAHHLLGAGPWSLGRGLTYIRVKGTRPA